jgi:type I restriction enzyme, S subunit
MKHLKLQKPFLIGKKRKNLNSNSNLILETETPKWIEIKLSEVISRGKRLEASFFEIEARKARKIINDCGFDKIILNEPDGMAKAWHRPRFKRIFIKKGIPIYTASQVLELNPKHHKSISDKTQTKLSLLYLKKDQITMTCSGTLGNISLVTKTLEKKLFSHDLIRIECYDKDDVGYLYAFLRTNIGKKLVTTNYYGSVITHLEPEHLSIPIPNPPNSIKKEINKKIRECFTLRDEGNELLKKADQILFQKLNLKRVDLFSIKYIGNYDVQAFESNKNDLELRFEASYHIPLVKKIKQQIQKNNPIPLKELANCYMLPTYKRIYVESANGIPILAGSHLHQTFPIGLKYISTIGFKQKSENYKIKNNWILISGRGTVGKCMLVPSYYENWMASHNIDRVIPFDLSNAGYLFVFLRSEYGQQLMQSKKLGSVVDVLTDEDLGEILIPDPPKKLKKEIGDLAFLANEKFTQAYNLEMNTIKKLEEIILNSNKK